MSPRRPRLLPPLTFTLVPVLLLALAPAARAADPTLHLNLYGNVNYSVEKEGSDPVTNSFSVPTMDMFLSSDFDRLSFSAEVLFDFDRDNNTFDFDVDRLQLSYLLRSWLRATIGRFHNAIGYYNTAYPHGAAYYELPIDRPALVDAHEASSLLPTLGVGLRLDGRVPVGAAGFASYDLEITNGHGYTPDEITTNLDRNQAKAYNLRLRFEPAFLDGLIIGGNAYLDTVAAAPAGTVGLPVGMKEQIFGAHIAYVEGNYHLILEGVVIRHLFDDGTKFQTLAGLVQLGYSIGNFTPYVRVEAARFPEGFPDPWYALGSQQARGNYLAVSAGLRYLVSTSLALKLELEENHATADDIRAATTQVAFSF
jgi:hypothetical protein